MISLFFTVDLRTLFTITHFPFLKKMPLEEKQNRSYIDGGNVNN
jgi:hypothetical protein